MGPRSQHQPIAMRRWMAAVITACIAWAAPAQAGPVDEVKAEFDAAMKKPLAERVPELNALDETIGRRVFGEGLSGEAKAKALRYRYHVRRQLAKYPDAYETYARQLLAWREAGQARRGHTTFLRDLNRWQRRRDHGHIAAVCRQVRQDVAADEKIEAAALYHLAKANYRMAGMLERALPLCERLIEEHPESPWRPEAMRVLANTQFGLGKEDQAIATLQLLEQQYPGTKLAHYADMRRAAVWEYGRGEPQKALSIYQQTLEKYPDHMYGAYAHRQIERLQRVIEKQLIDDALEGIGRRDGDVAAPRQADAETARPHQHNPIVDAATAPGPIMARE